MVFSSSSVMEWSGPVLKRNMSKIFHFENSQLIGVRRPMRKRMNGSENMAKRSGDSLARLLGLTSPKISTTIVMTTVETVAPYPAYSFTNSTVAIAVLAMFTRLFPTRIVERSVSYCSSSSSTFFARRFPSFAIFFSLIRFADVNAVSVAEKNPEKTSRTTIAPIYTHNSWVSIRFYSFIISVSGSAPNAHNPT